MLEKVEGTVTYIGDTDGIEIDSDAYAFRPDIAATATQVYEFGDNVTCDVDEEGYVTDIQLRG